MPVEAYIGEITIYPYNFAPNGTIYCHGQLLAISSNQALFSLLGTTYGGDGETTFNVPDLRGRTPVGQGTGPGLTDIQLGQMGGTDSVYTEPIKHSHTATLHGETTLTGLKRNPQGRLLAGAKIYATPIPADNLALSGESIVVDDAGTDLSRDSRNPFLGLNYCIALQGVFPSRN